MDTCEVIILHILPVLGCTRGGFVLVGSSAAVCNAGMQMQNKDCCTLAVEQLQPPACSCRTHTSVVVQRRHVHTAHTGLWCCSQCAHVCTSAHTSAPCCCTCHSMHTHPGSLPLRYGVSAPPALLGYAMLCSVAVPCTRWLATTPPAASLCWSSVTGHSSFLDWTCSSATSACWTCSRVSVCPSP